MSDLKARLLKSSTNKLTASLDDSEFLNNSTEVRTSIPIINLALSGDIVGGLSSGLTIFAGPSKHFKTNISLTLVAAYMKKFPDAICLFYDSEFGAAVEYFKMAGIDTSRVVHTPVQDVAQLKIDLTNQLNAIERGEKVIVLIDSIGNLASKKEVEDALNEKSVAEMSRAKDIKGMFRVITPYFGLKDIPCIAINHTIQTMEMFSKEVMTGGCLLAGTKVQMSDDTLKPIEVIKEGEYVKTLQGNKEVKYCWTPETLEDGNPECLEIEFDDGFSVVCSLAHKFLVLRNNSKIWVDAKNLKEGDETVTI